MVGDKVGRESTHFPKWFCPRSLKSQVYFALSHSPKILEAVPEIVQLCYRPENEGKSGIEGNSSGQNRPVNCLGVFMSRVTVVMGSHVTHSKQITSELRRCSPLMSLISFLKIRLVFSWNRFPALGRKWAVGRGIQHAKTCYKDRVQSIFDSFYAAHI